MVRKIRTRTARPRPYKQLDIARRKSNVSTSQEAPRESRFIIVATIIDISLTSAIAVAALIFAYQYNQRQEARERLQGIIASQQQCVEVQMNIPEWIKSTSDEAKAKAVINTVIYYSSQCKSAGFPIPDEQIKLVFEKFLNLNIASLKNYIKKFSEYSKSARLRQPALTAQRDLRIAREAIVESLPTDKLRLSSGFSSLERFIAGASIAQKSRIEVGSGVAWDSPFGPFRIDIEKALPLPSGDETNHVTFDTGTQF